MTDQKIQPNQKPSIFSKLWYLTSCIILVMIAVVFSCSRLDEAHPDPGITKVSAPIIPRSPSYVGDRLYFVDFDAFKDYFLELDSLFEYDQELFDSIVLATTPVTTIHANVSTTGGFQTFLSDPIMRAIVNPNYEFQIDSVMITYINDSQLLISNAANSTVKTSIRAITKGAALEIGDIPSGAFWGTPKDIEEALIITCKCKVYIEPLLPDCDHVRVHGSCYSWFGGNGDGALTVDFDPDGVIGSMKMLTEDVSGNFEFLIPISNFHGNVGIITAWVDPDCVTAGNASAEYYFDPANFRLCDNSDRSLTETITSSNNAERMIVTTSYYQNFWAYYHKSDIRSESSSNGGSSWSPSKANLYAKVDANRKGSGCNFIDSKNDFKNCSDCKSKTVRVSWTNPCYHCDGDLIGTYRKIRSSLTLTRTQTVNFECCE